MIKIRRIDSIEMIWGILSIVIWNLVHNIDGPYGTWQWQLTLIAFLVSFPLCLSKILIFASPW